MMQYRRGTRKRPNKNEKKYPKDVAPDSRESGFFFRAPGGHESLDSIGKANANDAIRQCARCGHQAVAGRGYGAHGDDDINLSHIRFSRLLVIAG
jgi:hypothetical protein